MLAQLLFILGTHDEIAFRMPVVDAAGYHQQALDRQPASGQPYWQPPLYVWLLGGMYRILPSDSELVVRMAHGFIGAMAVLLTGLLASRTAGLRAAVATVVLLSLYGPFLFYSSQLLPAVPAALMDLLAIWSTLFFHERPSRRSALLCGVALGLAALAVPNILVFLPVPLIVAYRSVPARATRMVNTALVLAGVLACILPVTVRNRIVSGTWVPISVNSGVNLYVGNNPDTSVTLAIRPNQGWNRLLRMPFAAGVKSAAEGDRWFAKQVAAYAMSDPSGYVLNLGHKALELVNGYEAPRNTSLYAYRERSPWLRALVWRLGGFGFPFSLLLPFAVLGLVVAGRRSFETRVMASFVILYACSIVAFFPADRYRLPLVPILMIFAVAGAISLVDAFHMPGASDGKSMSSPLPLGFIPRIHPEGERVGVRGGHDPAFKTTVIARLGILIIAALVASLPLKFPTDGVPFDAELDMYIGVGLQTRGQVEDAIRYYNAALDKAPDLADAWYFLGSAQRAAGRRQEAVDSFRTCLASQPDHEKAMHDLAVVLAQQRDLDGAAVLLEEVLQLNPANTRAMTNLGIIRARQGRLEEASTWLRRAGAIPGHTEIGIAAGPRGPVLQVRPMKQGGP